MNVKRKQQIVSLRYHITNIYIYIRLQIEEHRRRDRKISKKEKELVEEIRELPEVERGTGEDMEWKANAKMTKKMHKKFI